MGTIDVIVVIEIIFGSYSCCIVLCKIILMNYLADSNVICGLFCVFRVAIVSCLILRHNKIVLKQSVFVTGIQDKVI